MLSIQEIIEIAEELQQRGNQKKKLLLLNNWMSCINYKPRKNREKQKLTCKLKRERLDFKLRRKSEKLKFKLKRKRERR